MRRVFAGSVLLVLVALLLTGHFAIAHHREVKAWETFRSRQAKASTLRERGALREDVRRELGTPEAIEREGRKEFWIYRVRSKGMVKERLIVTLDLETGRLEDAYVLVVN